MKTRRILSVLIAALMILPMAIMGVGADTPATPAGTVLYEENYGNTAAIATDNVVLSDTFTPILDPITVTYNGVVWTEGVNYTYDATTGVFSTVVGQITVPAATYTQNPDGTWTVVPGVAVVTVNGTV